MDNMEEKKENLIQVDLREIMETSFLDYHRRILYTMYENALWPEKAYRKCADTVGSVLGRYHPHGDASVYDALVRLAQDFSMRYMLIDGHGNFGSVDGDPPAAYRYTEARMSKLSVEMLKDIEKDTVDFSPNYDDRLKEPPSCRIRSTKQDSSKTSQSLSRISASTASPISTITPTATVCTSPSTSSVRLPRSSF